MNIILEIAVVAIPNGGNYSENQIGIRTTYNNLIIDKDEFEAKYDQFLKPVFSSTSFHFIEEYKGWENRYNFGPDTYKYDVCYHMRKVDPNMSKEICYDELQKLMPQLGNNLTQEYASFKSDTYTIKLQRNE